MVAVGAGDEGTAVCNVSRITTAAEEASRVDLKGSRVDRGPTGVGIVPGEDQNSAAVFGERSGATDDPREDLVAVGAGDEGTAVCNVSRVTTSSKETCGGDLKSSGADGDGSGMGIIAREGQNSTSALHKTASAGDQTREGGVAGGITREGSRTHCDIARTRKRSQRLVVACEVEGASGNIEV